MSDFTPEYFTEELFNLAAPKEIVPIIMDIVKPKNVLDVGCGTGTFLHCFKQNGVSDVLGVDGPWVNKELLNKHLSTDEFQELNLNNEVFDFNKKFDLVVSLEVANHLEEKRADIFVENLVASGKVIVFSSAVAYQGGDNQVNLQLLSYWEEKFLKHDYIIQDIFRPIFWNNPKVNWWYKQNMVLITPKKYKIEPNDALKVVLPKEMRDIIHPDLYIGQNQAYYHKFFRSTFYQYFMKIIKRIFPFLLWFVRK